jgi:hypothetical protein
VPELLDYLRVYGAHRVKIGKVCLERGDAHTRSAQFLDQGDSHVVLREIMQCEVNTARSEETRRRLSDTAPARCGVSVKEQYFVEMG